MIVKKYVLTEMKCYVYERIIFYAGRCACTLTPVSLVYVSENRQPQWKSRSPSSGGHATHSVLIRESIAKNPPA